jgi:hypothetical protein
MITIKQSVIALENNSIAGMAHSNIKAAFFT